ncbi:MAG: Crp/Fnr family transcriptional regulator [Erythrobacter sp.]
MATAPLLSKSLSPEVASMDMFRAAIPQSARHSPVADRLCAIGQYRFLHAREELPGDDSEDRLIFVTSGATKLIAKPPALTRAQARQGGQNAKIQVLAFYFPGDIVSVLRETDGNFRIVGLKDTELIVFFADQFLDVAQDDPAVLRSMLASSIQALHASRTGMMQLGHKSAGDRIADFLGSMALRFCGCTDGACEFTLPMSRRDIADSLGLAIETVSRQFAELRDLGLIETQGRSIVRVRDLDTLLRKRSV